MSDNKNPKNENAPFGEKPFSIDVWEQAYKNVGRPFAKAPFEIAPTESAKSATPTNGHSGIKLERSTQSQSATNPSRPATKPTVTPSTRLQSPVIDRYYTKSAYDQKPEASSSGAYIPDEEKEIKSISQLLDEGLDGSIPDIIRQIKEALGIKSNKSRGKPSNIIWFIIAIIFMIIMGLLEG